jgi:predicted XRE-type DNA-binding protein
MATGKASRGVVAEAAAAEAEIDRAEAKEEMSYEVSSGNVYADLGFDDAEEMAAKAGLVREIRRTMDRRGLTQVQVAKLTGVDQPTLSKLLRGRMSNFSFDRLTEMLRDLGRNMVLLVEEEPEGTETGLPNVTTVKKATAVKPSSKGHMVVATATTVKFVEVSGQKVIGASEK